MRDKKRKKILPLLAFPLLILSVIALVFIFKDQLLSIFSSPEKLKAWVEKWGLVAPLIFIGLQFLQVVAFIIPGEIPQIAGGYLFGAWLGILYSLLGITLGSAFNFFLARLLGRPFVRSIVGEEQIGKFEKFSHSRKAKFAFFLFFLIPGIPKDALCYIAGMSSMRFVPFLLISIPGRLPGIFGSAFIGEAASSKKWFLAGSILLGALILFLFGMLFREQIRKLIERITSRAGERQD